MSSSELIEQGKTFLNERKIDKAVECFQSACELLAKEHGDLDEKLAHPNYLYGCSLLALAKIESDIIGDSLKGVLPDGDNKEEDDNCDDIVDKSENPLSKTQLEEISEKVVDAMCEDRSAPAEDGESKESDKPEEKEADKSVEKAEEVKEDTKEPEAEKEAEGDAEDKTEGEAEEAKAEGDAEEGDEEEASDEASPEDEEEEVSNLQLAWEVFEVSKNIYSKIDTKEAKISVTNCLLKLAEVSREKDDFDQAIVDLKLALDSRKEILDASDRLIAEVHFELAITYFTKGELDNATTSFEDCTKVLNEYLVKLKEVELKDEKKSEEEKKKLEEEVAEISEIVKEVEQRCADCVEELKAGNKPVLTMEKPGFVSKTDAEAVDINHLVKKKRAVDEEGKENDETALKKQKIDESCKKVENGSVESTVENGAAAINGH